jgi:ABC-type dipeptide/oligopeptide/nickel transport system permease subunit
MNAKPATILSLLWTFTIILISIIGPLVAPFNPEQPISDPLLPPNSSSFLGTDSLGRDQFSRLIFGARNTLSLSISAAVLTIGVGSVIGLLAATFPGIPDRSLLWLLNSALAIPGLLLAMLFVAGLGPGIDTVILAVGVGGIPGFARISRTIFKQTLSQGFVQSIHALGGNWIWNSWYHILPNASFRLIPLATLHIAWAFLGTTTLTFLGFAGDPALPEWGAMLNAGRLHLVQQPFLAIIPGTLMSFTILAIHTLGTWIGRISHPYNAGWRE